MDSSFLERDEAPPAQKLEGLYHKAQKDTWDGKETLARLIAEHGQPQLPLDKQASIRKLLGVILLGEQAAWKVSVALTYSLPTIEPALAAQAQATDEARHVYVLREYLKEEASCFPIVSIGNADVQELYPWRLNMSPKALEFFDSVFVPWNVEKMIMGMQLMVEPLALTVLKLIRKEEHDPILTELLTLIEKDEARHVGLGIQYLPTLLNKMSWWERGSLILWQCREYMRQFAMLKELEPDFATLGISTREVFELAKKKQYRAIELTAEQYGKNLPATDLILKLIDARAKMMFG